MGYCRGTDTHIQVVELDSKVWHDDDLYEMTCLKCGKKDTMLSRRPSQTQMVCGQKKE
jgi:hypothetical protein